MSITHPLIFSHGTHSLLCNTHKAALISRSLLCQIQVLIKKFYDRLFIFFSQSHVLSHLVPLYLCAETHCRLSLCEPSQNRPQKRLRGQGTARATGGRTHDVRKRLCAQNSEATSPSLGTSSAEAPPMMAAAGDQLSFCVIFFTPGFIHA